MLAESGAAAAAVTLCSKWLELLATGVMSVTCQPLVMCRPLVTYRAFVQMTSKVVAVVVADVNNAVV